MTVGNWQREPKTVTLNAFVGKWKCDGYGDPDLEDTQINKGQFSALSKMIEFTKENNTIMAHLGVDTIPLSIKNGRASINVPVPGESVMYYALSIVTDGSGLAIYMVTTPLNDPHKVSVAILLGVKQK